MPPDPPDPLERLDDDLAAGRIDASTFRRRRDELLAGDPAPSAPAPPAPAAPAPAAPAPAPLARPADDRGTAPPRRPSPPVPPHLTTPPWTGAAPAPGTGPRPRMQGSEVFAPGPPRPLAILGTVLVVALALAVLVASFLI